VSQLPRTTCEAVPDDGVFTAQAHTVYKVKLERALGLGFRVTNIREVHHMLIEIGGNV
jgi:hypothetical protein